MSMRMKIKKGDEVLVISGKERGKRGKIQAVFPSERRVIVEGIFLVKKHRRPRRADEKSEEILVPRPVSASKVKLVCPKCGSATRVKLSLRDGVKTRICKKCQSEI